MKKQTITLQTNKGPQDVQAYPTKCPNLFIHIPLGHKSGWRVSHLPSGYCIFPNIKKLSDAFSACEIWAKIDGWDKLTPDKAKEFFDKNYKPYLDAGRNAALGITS